MKDWKEEQERIARVGKSVFDKLQNARREKDDKEQARCRFGDTVVRMAPYHHDADLFEGIAAMIVSALRENTPAQKRPVGRNPR